MQKNITPTRLVNGLMIVSGISLITSIGIITSSVAGYVVFPDLAFIIPLFIGTSIFFVGQYLEAKYENTFGIDWYISNRKTKMRSAIAGCIMSIVVAIASLFII